MIKEAIATGDSVDAALANACAQLGVETTDVEFEILEMERKKTLGIFGGRPAKVRAYIEVPDPVQPAPPPAAPVSAEPVVVEAKPEPASEKAVSAPAAPLADGDSDPAQNAADYLKSVLTCMGLADAVVEVQPMESGANLVLSGGDIGFVIGHRGETLDALQYLASLVANHTGGSYFRLTLDVGNYREKRRETLEALGKKMAYRAVKTGRNASLEPMNPYERRIIHTAVQEIEGAKSWSEGEDQGRHVVIGPEGGERFQSRRDRRDNRRGGYNSNYNKDRGYDRDRRNSRPPRSQNPAPRPGGPKADDPSTPIYGKIEAKK